MIESILDPLAESSLDLLYGILVGNSEQLENKDS